MLRFDSKHRSFNAGKLASAKIHAHVQLYCRCCEALVLQPYAPHSQYSIRNWRLRYAIMRVTVSMHFTTDLPSVIWPSGSLVR